MYTFSHIEPAYVEISLSDKIKSQFDADIDFVHHVAIPHFYSAKLPAPINEMIDFTLSMYAPINELEYE